MGATIGRPRTSPDVACICGQCGTGFTVPDHTKTGRKFCSKECVDAWRTGRPRGKAEPHKHYTCKTCGIGWSQIASKKIRTVFCSVACYQADRRAKRQISDETTAPKKLGRPSKGVRHCKCEMCGTGYDIPASRVSGLRFCSMECTAAYRTGRPFEGRKITPTEVLCAHCSSPFLTGGRGRRRLESKYCSAECQRQGVSRHPPVRQMTPEEIAWLAGLFDGEGNIAWPQKAHVHSARVSIANTCFPLLGRLIEVTGTGSITSLRNGTKNPNHSAAANWACFGDRARDILRLIIPWLIVKRENAELVIRAFEEWSKNRVLSAERPHHPRLERALAIAEQAELASYLTEEPPTD